MTVREFMEEQARSYGFVTRYTSPDGRYRELIPVVISGQRACASSAIEFLRVLQENSFTMEFMRGSVRVWAPHKDTNDGCGHGWDCTYGLTPFGCEAVRRDIAFEKQGS